MFKKKNNSMLVRVLDTAEKPNPVLFGLCIIAAILCDALRTLGHILACILLVIIVSCGIMLAIVWAKAKPLYTEYMAKAENAVAEATTDTFRYNETTTIYDKTGKVMATLSDGRNTEYLAYEDIPMNVINAFIAVEDRTFWTNPGIDWKGIGRVVVNAVASKGDDIAGASTITQQLARAVFLSNNVSIDRKLTEMGIAIKLTEKFSKEQIMEFYVNNCYFANGYYGIESAAKGYFGKSVKDLTLGETAYLCAIPNSPTYYDPRVNPDRALERRDIILESMYEVGYISKEEMEDGKAETYEILAVNTDIGGYDTTYAIDCAVRQFMKTDGFVFKYHFDTNEEYKEYQTAYNAEYESMRNELLRGGYSVYTSIDSELQESLQQITDEYVAQKQAQTGYDDFEAAVVVTNSQGLAKAIIGGGGDGGFGFNRGYQAYRQPGSTIKPLVVYAPAVESGYIASSAVTNINVADVQRKIKEAQQRGEIVDVTKEKGTTVTLRYALEQSLNGVAYSLMAEITPKTCLEYLEQMDFSEIVPEDYNLSASLGGLTNGATPIEMAGGYACLLNDGSYNEPTCITSIIDRYGNEQYTKLESKRVFSEKTAQLVTDLMAGVAKTGTASSLKWYESSDTTLYCKTGTTDDKKDNWMCGYAGDNVVVTWVGCDTPKDLGTYGATGAGELFKKSVLKALEFYAEEKEETDSAEAEDNPEEDSLLEQAAAEAEKKDAEAAAGNSADEDALIIEETTETITEYVEEEEHGTGMETEGNGREFADYATEGTY